MNLGAKFNIGSERVELLDPVYTVTEKRQVRNGRTVADPERCVARGYVTGVRYSLNGRRQVTAEVCVLCQVPTRRADGRMSLTLALRRFRSADVSASRDAMEARLESLAGCRQKRQAEARMLRSAAPETQG